MHSLKTFISFWANIKLALHLDGKSNYETVIVCDGNAFQAKNFEFAPNTRSVHWTTVCSVFHLRQLFPCMPWQKLQRNKAVYHNI